MPGCNIKRLFFVQLFFVALLLPVLVFAHGTGYLEFNPDNSNSLKVADVNTPSQVFFAQNDFLGGADFWVANPGASGFATFALLNEQGSVLTSRTVTVPTIAETANGTRFHVDFSSQLSVLADNRYSIRITSSMPGLRFYYSNRVQLVSYNSPFVSEYITGVGKLGSEEQVFSFKYALYETNETSAPIISNTGWTVVLPEEMRVDFNANEPVDYRIEYGPSGQAYSSSTSFLGEYQFCASGIATCKLNISVLPNTTYGYALTVKDSWGNQSQITGTFESGEGQAPVPTATPTPIPTISPTPAVSATPLPTIGASPTSTPGTAPSGLLNLRAVNITDRSADIVWTTDEPANSDISVVREFDFTFTVTAVSDPTLELEHLLGTGDVLGPNTTYVARVKSANSAGEASANLTFTTLPPSGLPTPTPQPSVPPAQVTTSSSGGGGSVVWNAPADGEPSDGYRVDIFDKDGNFVKTVIVPAGSTSADIPGLEEGEYSVIVYANNEGVYEKVAQPAKLKVREDDTFLKRLISFWWILVPLVAGLGYLLWRNFKNKTSQIPQTPVTS